MENRPLGPTDLFIYAAGGFVSGALFVGLMWWILSWRGL